MQETRKTRVQLLGQKDPLEEEMATHSIILAWRIPWTEELCRLQFLGSWRVRHDWVTEQTDILKKRKKKKKKLRYIKWNTHNYTDCNFKKKKPILAGSQVSLISTQQCFWNNLWILLNFQVTKWFTIFSYIFFLPKMSWGDNYPPFYELHY